MNFLVEHKELYSWIKVQVPHLDGFVSPELKTELVMIAGKGVSNIVLDMSDCMYCASSGVSALLVGNRLCEENGGVFIITKVHPNVFSMLKMAMLDTILIIASDADEAQKIIKDQTDDSK